MDIHYSELRRSWLLSPAEGSEIIGSSPDGEVIAHIGYQGGIHKLDQLTRFFPPGTTFNCVNGAIAQQNPDRVAVTKLYATESGANPDFTPRRLTDNEKVLFNMVRGLQTKVDASTKRAEAAQQALDRKTEKEPATVLVDEDDKPTGKPEKPVEEPAAAE